MTIDADIRGPGMPLIRVHVDGEGTTQEAADALDRAFTVREPREDISGYFFCTACGGYVECGWKFCPECGQRIRRED